jgi:hypothetical protein
MFIAKEYIGVARQLPTVVEYLREYSIAEEYQTEKAQLIRYADELLKRAKNLVI